MVRIAPKSITLLVLFLSVVVALLTLGTTTYCYSILELERPNAINVLSVVGFVGICAYSLYSYRVYFFFLPFILLAYPAAASDFFPSVYMGPKSEIGAALFPIINHLDVFLFVGALKRISDEGGRVRIKINLLTFLVIICFLLSFIVNLGFAENRHHIALLVSGLFPLRCILMLVIITSMHDVWSYEKQIINGLMVSILFLLLESLVNTRISNAEQLTSGTLASNTYANIVAAILIFLIYLHRQKYPIPKIYFFSMVGVCVVIILLTQTRMAILAGVASFLLIQMYLFKWYKTFLVVVAVCLLAVLLYNFIDVPERYSIKMLTSKIHVYRFSWNVFDMVSIDRSAATNSLITRLQLYRTALNMFGENPLFGTGYGTFDYFKNQYGFEEFVLIDSHNGYLNTIAQMGISSIFFLYFIYFYPIFNFKSIHFNSYLKYLFTINFTMALADFSNAGIYKPGVFALLAMNVLILAALKGQIQNRIQNPGSTSGENRNGI